MRPVPHSDSNPAPTFSSFTQSFNETDKCTSEDSSIESDDYYPSSDQEKRPVLIKQSFLNDLVRDLNLPKDAAELLGSRLHNNNLLAPGTTFSFYRQRKEGLLPYFNMDDTLVFCHDIGGFLHAMGCEYDPKEWRLFIDSSKASLKCVLLHNGNRYASVPIGHSVQLKET